MRVHMHGGLVSLVSGEQARMSLSEDVGYIYRLELGLEFERTDRRGRRETHGPSAVRFIPCRSVPSVPVQSV